MEETPVTPEVVRRPKRVKPKSRSKRWMDAAGEARAALDEVNSAIAKFEEATGELRSVQEEYQEWLENLPENLQQSPSGEKLQAISELDIESLAESLTSAVSEAEGVIDEAEGIDLPMGFGRD